MTLFCHNYQWNNSFAGIVKQNIDGLVKHGKVQAWNEIIQNFQMA